ncbi:MAG: DMT family transporter [Candidatus Cryptobacteroides sp.]
MTGKKNFFTHRVWVPVLSLTCAVLWGWAFPLLKLGFSEFGITAEMTASKMVYAGLRFTFAGLLILLIAGILRKDFRVRSSSGGIAGNDVLPSQTASTPSRPAPTGRLNSWLYILAFALMNTTLHYAFFYIGMSHSVAARASILNSMGTFILVILACLFFESDKMTLKKTVGVMIGILGIFALNFGNSASGGFSWMGDGMILLNTTCSAFAGLMTRGLAKRVDVFVGTGYALSIGGALLLVPGLLAGGMFPQVTPAGIAILASLVGISTIGFSIYNKLISCNPVGKVAVFNSLIPVVGTLSSCLLGEAFQWNYLIAGTLAALGIFLVNKSK